MTRILATLARLGDRITVAMFGPVVPESHAWAGPSVLDRKDGRS